MDKAAFREGECWVWEVRIGDASVSAIHTLKPAEFNLAHQPGVAAGAQASGLLGSPLMWVSLDPDLPAASEMHRDQWQEEFRMIAHVLDAESVAVGMAVFPISQVVTHSWALSRAACGQSQVPCPQVVSSGPSGRQSGRRTRGRQHHRRWVSAERWQVSAAAAEEALGWGRGGGCRERCLRGASSGKGCRGRRGRVLARRPERKLDSEVLSSLRSKVKV